VVLRRPCSEVKGPGSPEFEQKIFLQRRGLFFFRAFFTGKCPFPPWAAGRQPRSPLKPSAAAQAGPISTLRPFSRLRASSAVHRYASAQTLYFLAPFGAALGNPEMTGRQTVRAPFGAALGNPEMTGRQTVRAMGKNAFFPNGNLAGRGICPGVSGWILLTRFWRKR